MIIKGIRESIPVPKTEPKPLMYKERMREGPTEFLQRLRDHMRKYSGLSLDDPLGQGMLELHFVTDSWPEIWPKKKLQ
jgi:hypothetical protein